VSQIARTRLRSCSRARGFVRLHLGRAALIRQDSNVRPPFTMAPSQCVGYVHISCITKHEVQLGMMGTSCVFANLIIMMFSVFD